MASAETKKRLTTFAKKHNKKPEDLIRYWDEAESADIPKDVEDEFAYKMGIVKKRAGLTEDKVNEYWAEPWVLDEPLDDLPVVPGVWVVGEDDGDMGVIRAKDAYTAADIFVRTFQPTGQIMVHPATQADIDQELKWGGSILESFEPLELQLTSPPCPLCGNSNTQVDDTWSGDFICRVCGETFSERDLDLAVANESKQLREGFESHVDRILQDEYGNVRNYYWEFGDLVIDLGKTAAARAQAEDIARVLNANPEIYARAEVAQDPVSWRVTFKHEASEGKLTEAWSSRGREASVAGVPGLGESIRAALNFAKRADTRYDNTLETVSYFMKAADNSAMFRWLQDLVSQIGLPTVLRGIPDFLRVELNYDATGQLITLTAITNTN